MFSKDFLNKVRHILRGIVITLKRMSAAKKRFFIIIAFFLVINITFICLMFSVRNRSAVSLEYYGSSELSRLIALDDASRTGRVKDGEYAYFKFTEGQKALFNKMYQESETAALTVRLEFSKKESINQLNTEYDDKKDFLFGFLTQEDFTTKGKLKPFDRKKILVQGYKTEENDKIDLSFALKKNDDFQKVIPQGFFVSAQEDCKILAACIVPAVMGFDLSGEVPFYGFSCTGGIVQPKNKSFDFSGGSMIFPVSNSTKSSMPEFLVKLSDNPELKASKERAVRGEINIGGEKLYINNVASASTLNLPSGALKAPFSRLDIQNNDECILAVLMRSTYLASPQVLVPVKTDPGLILKYKQSAWRTSDYEIFEWDRFDKILFFDTRNYDVQDRFFRRMAYYVEKEGYKGRLLTNEELEGKHGYNAHDYSAESMASFFNKAKDLNFKLNYEEELLKQILIKNGLLEVDGERLKANNGGLVSISQESEEWRRNTLLAHEGWHTIFFRDEDFRNFVSAVYYTMDPSSLQFLIEYFKSQPSLGYDVNDDYLMHNEFMAYIMQQKLSEVAAYFVHLANRGSVMKATPTYAAYVRETKGRGFEDAAIAMNDYVYDRFGIVCGNIALVSR